MRIKGKKLERRISERALEAFNKNTNLNAAIKKNKKAQDVTFEVGLGDIKWTFAIEVRENVTRTSIGIIDHQRQLQPQYKDVIWLTRYITPPIADLMKAYDIPFVDTAGNAYINDPPLYIFIKGNKNPENDYPKPPARAFRPTGLQVVFALLCDKGLESSTYREIAKKADVALGTVGWVMRDLTEMGYLIDMGKRGRRLTDKFNLFIRWVNAYSDELKPKKLIGRYRADTFDWWKDTEIEKYQAYWGGEVAATMLTGYLKPESTTIYTRKPLGDLMLKHKIRKDPKGDIETLDAFWNFEYQWKYNNLVPPLLIYADLQATGDKRNTETADIIYEQEIDRLIGED